MTTQHRNYHKLRRLLPDLDQLREGDRVWLVAEGREPIVAHVLWVDDQRRLMMTVGRYVRVQGDVRPDPEVTLAVFLAASFVKALACQDPDRFDRIDRGDFAPRLDDFLSLWLSNLYEQGYKVAPG